MYNNLPILEEPDGSEYMIVEKDGVWMKTLAYKMLATTPPTITTAPTGFTATAFDSNQIDTAWSGTADNFILERCREGDGAWAEIYSGAGTSFSDTGLYPEEDYNYRLKAQVTGQADSEWVYADETTPPA